jgi:hypothetical protein
VTAIDAARARLVELGARMDAIEARGGERVCRGADPEQHVFQIVQR